ncbi:MAG: 3'(2'),5'-bisphosphate nucleotidase CysQ [Bacteroidales bacterium]|jgi:3'(2'), 5'-bisphosphate nucleotidase|nr:3'(2'),5'-bisphosphate nucleotidase CysQ [Bacteroidales bacterium]
MNKLLEFSCAAALEAGKAILDIYRAADFGVETKPDHSPLTLADKASHHIIESILQSTGIPILSEEGKDIPSEVRRNWRQFWLVDPLDGTKEFISRNGEFTVNIALIRESKPVLGIILAPVNDILYWGLAGAGSYRLTGASGKGSSFRSGDLYRAAERLPVNTVNRTVLVAAASRSHSNEKTRQFIESLQQEHGEVEFISKGSSLKLCLVAEGSADIYPRFGPTFEWDTAAGQAIVEQAGGKVIIAESGHPMTYNKETLLNPEFVAVGLKLQATGFRPIQ